MCPPSDVLISAMTDHLVGYFGPLMRCPMAEAAGLSSQARHMAAVQEKLWPPAPAPVSGSKYSASPAHVVSCRELSRTLSARAE